jgi:hypothetical protein
VGISDRVHVSHLASGCKGRNDEGVATGEPVVYRTEVIAIIGALSDLLVDVRASRKWLQGNDEEEEDQENS